MRISSCSHVSSQGHAPITVKLPFFAESLTVLAKDFGIVKLFKNIRRASFVQLSLLDHAGDENRDGLRGTLVVSGNKTAFFKLI